MWILPEPLTLIAHTVGNPDSVPPYIMDAAIMLSKGDAIQCLQALNNAPVKYPDSLWGWIVAATAHCQLKNYQVACDVAQRGLRQVGNNTRLLDCLGVAYCGLKDYANAQKLFLEAVKLHSHNTNAIINLANLFLSLNHPDAAFQTVEQGLEKNPNCMEIRYLFVALHPAWIQPLIGGRLRLRLLKPADNDFLERCFDNQSFMDDYNRNAAHHQTKQQLINNIKQNPQYGILKHKSVNWLIEQTGNPNNPATSDKAIGIACLADIQFSHQRAEISIGFPDKTHRGNGAAIKCMLLIFDYAFNRIGLNKLTSLVYSDNRHSQRTTLSLGFSQEGFRPAHLYDVKNRQWLDVYENGLLHADFRHNERLTRLSKRFLGLDITHATVKKTVFGQ
jgi:diamine N-acetyltransferase